MADLATVPLQIENPDSHKLAGILLEPPSPHSSPPPLVVLCHGFRSSKRSSSLEAVAGALREQGIASFRFDFSGNGESEGQFAVGNYWAEVEDLRSVVMYWRKEGRNVAAILGHSKGGNVVLLYASKYKDIPCVINLAARCVMERGLKERYGEDGLRTIQEQGFLKVDNTWEGSYRVTKEDIEQRLATDMRAAASSIPASCRVLSVHGSEDATVPVEDARILAGLIVNHELKVVDGGDHRFSSPYRGNLINSVVPFVVSSLAQ